MSINIKKLEKRIDYYIETETQESWFKWLNTVKKKHLSEFKNPKDKATEGMAMLPDVDEFNGMTNIFEKIESMSKVPFKVYLPTQ